MPAREALNTGINDQGLGDVDVRWKGAPTLFHNIAPECLEHSRARAWVHEESSCSLLRASIVASSRQYPWMKTLSLFGKRKTNLQLPPGHCIDQTIAFIAQRRNRI